MVNSGFVRPHDRVVINLAPAELPKQAASFDLSISLGILVGSGQFSSERLEQYSVVGELALLGNARPVKGASTNVFDDEFLDNLRGDPLAGTAGLDWFFASLNGMELM